MMENSCAVILAAGEGKRMKSKSPKVLSEVLFKPMLGWVIDAVSASNIKDICVISGFRHEEVEEYLSNNYSFCKSALQLERKGTAHAVKMAEDFLKVHKGKDVLILNGDAPFISSKTIEDAYNMHKSQRNAGTVVSACLDNPFGYGRIVRNKLSGKVEAIVEQKDANEDIQKINEVNSGAYWFNVDSLLSVLDDISNNNAQGEYYLPDALKLLLKRNNDIDAFVAQSQELGLGANDCFQLYELNQIARSNIIKGFMDKGIKIPCHDGIIIGPDVSIGEGSTILSGSIISGATSIGNNCIVGPNSYIVDSTVGSNVKLNCVSIEKAYINDNEGVKPFTCL